MNCRLLIVPAVLFCFAIQPGFAQEKKEPAKPETMELARGKISATKPEAW
ncbi:MAG: hypothetical protein ABL921_26085 [Pirellula sp.]